MSARTFRANASDFLRFDEASRMHATMSALGFVLSQHPRVWNEGAHLTVRLVWRNRATRDSATLALRVRLVR